MFKSTLVDLSGPLLFLKNRWGGGPKWRPVWVRFFAAWPGVTIQAHTKEGGLATAGVYLHRDYWASMDYRHREDFVMGYVRKFTRPDQDSLARTIAHDAELSRDYPAIHDYLTAIRDDDGTPRRTSTLTVFCEAGGWKTFLNERQINASLCASGSTLSEALSGLEVMLEAENTPWRWNEVRPSGGGKKGRQGS